MPILKLTDYNTKLISRHLSAKKKILSHSFAVVFSFTKINAQHLSGSLFVTESRL